LTSELMYYEPRAIPVVQFNERLRWVSFAQPMPETLSRRGLYIADAGHDFSSQLANRFTRVTKIGEVSRSRHDKQIQRYVLYRVEAPITSILDTNLVQR